MSMWTVWCPELGQQSAEQGEALDSLDAEDAALRFVARRDAEAAAMLGDGQPVLSALVVHVVGQDDGEGSGATYEVAGRWQPFYTARFIQ